MCGLCWFVQIVHYPLFRAVRIADLPQYEQKNFVTGYVTVPIMTVELISGIWYLLMFHDTIFIYNIVLLGIIWGSTFIFQVPIHLKIARSPTPQLINKLVTTNWIRTLGWSIRCGLLADMVLN
tara:strand:- start:375 stop:743 length:369 start_codon:yes stop_codon:yes gene_type:complete